LGPISWCKLAATAALVVLLCGACTDPATDDRSESQISVERLRLDYLRVSDDLRVAKTLLANECMRNLGFASLPIAQIPESFVTGSGSGGQVARLSLTVDEATTDGYAATTEWKRRNAVDPRETIAKSLDPQVFDQAWGEAWSGGIGLPDSETTPRGCFVEAGAMLLPDELDGTIQFALNEVASLVNDVRATADIDPNYRAHLEQWKRCMAEAGLGPFNEIHEPFVAALSGSGEVDPIDIAIADATCQDASGVIDAYIQAWEQAEQEIGQTKRALAFNNWEREHLSDITTAVYQALAEGGLEPSS